MKKYLLFDFSTISKYRTELMGIGALGVILAHNIRWNEWPFWFTLCSKIISSTVFTQGFLFLSGFGLFFSLSKQPKLGSFYRKRFERLIIPFWCIVASISLLRICIGSTTVTQSLIHLSCIGWFFALGGSWYVSLSVLLYAITPFLFNYLFTNDRSVKSVVKRAIFVTLVVTFIIELIRFTAPSYFSALEIGLTQMPAYILGLFGGYLAVKGYKSYWVIPALAFFFIILLVLSHVFPAIESYKLIMLRLLCICLICNILQCIINKMGGVFYGHSDGWAHIRLNCI